MAININTLKTRALTALIFVAVMMVGLPTAIAVMVLAPPVPVPIARTEPCAEIAEDAMIKPFQWTKKKPLKSGCG